MKSHPLADLRHPGIRIPERPRWTADLVRLAVYDLHYWFEGEDPEYPDAHHDLDLIVVGSTVTVTVPEQDFRAEAEEVAGILDERGTPVASAADLDTARGLRAEGFGEVTDSELGEPILNW